MIMTGVWGMNYGGVRGVSHGTLMGLVIPDLSMLE